jgi:hypothetical protein
MSRARWLLAVGTLLVAGVAISLLSVRATFLSGKAHDEASYISVPPSVPGTAATPTAVPQQAQRRGQSYRNTSYRFELTYPLGLTAREYNEARGALTIAFEDPEGTKGFEVYVVPYTEPTISAAQFRMDEPSGVIQQRTDVVIDGVRATMFFGNNGIMGDTREVWFINEGFLYEVTTYKALDAWLSEIMTTWKFL